MDDHSEKCGVEFDKRQIDSEVAKESDSTDSSSSSEVAEDSDSTDSRFGAEDISDSDDVSLSTPEELSFESEDEDCYDVNSKHARAPLSEPLFTSLKFRGGVDLCSLHPKDDNLVAVCSGKTFSLFNIKENSIYHEKKFEDVLSDCQFSYNGEFIHVVVNIRSHYVMHTDNLEILRKTNRDDIYICRWHPFKQLLCLATAELGMLIVSFPDVKIRIMEYEFECFDLFAFFPSGDRILAAFRCGKFCVWDLESLETIATFIDKEDEKNAALVDNMEINKSGTIAAYSYCSFKIKIISLFDGSLLAHIPYGVRNYETYDVTLAFSNDDNYLAVGNGIGEAYIIATCSFELQSKFKNRYKARISRLQWNDRTLFVGFADGYVRSIDIITGDLIKEFHCHSDMMCDFQLFKHENKFMTGSRDGTIKIFGC